MKISQLEQMRQATAADLRVLSAWCRSRGWKPFPFQRETWGAMLAGQSGLLHAPTGTGKTLAAWLGALARSRARPRRAPVAGPRILWITPLKALATDTLRALEQPLPELREWLAGAAAVSPGEPRRGAPALPAWRVDLRTGDSSAAKRRQLSRAWPEGLITTPETLSILLALDSAAEVFAALDTVVVDEWHELLATKRGVQTELALARLRTLSPGLCTWGLSATLANLDEALTTLVGPPHAAAARLITARIPRRLQISTLIPAPMERFPWAGHMGMRLLPQVVATIEAATTSLVFTNTRAQAERWHEAIAKARPDWQGLVALHHGSVDRDLRLEAEEGLRRGSLKCVVATSSLDLGVDFGPVEQVLQIGSPKGVARLLQRAGRSGHAPGATGRLVCVPTHSLELIECAAARTQVLGGVVEARRSLTLSLDVLAQHIVSTACSGGFRPAELLAEVRSTHAFATLDDRSWQWALDFAARGGQALTAYPDFSRIKERFGRWYIASPAAARRQRMSIGTIAGEATVEVRWLRGGRLGTVEESFISRLNPGDRFLFAGRGVALFRFDGLTAWVKKSRSTAGLQAPRWNGGRLPLSTLLAGAVQELVRSALQPAGRVSREVQAVRPLLETQARWSRLPDPDTLLIEHHATRKSAGGAPHQIFLYPFAGRLVHDGLAALVAWRIASRRPSTLQLSATDWGLQLAGRDPPPTDARSWRTLLSPANVLEDLLECLNTTEMARRHFREVARVAGLVSGAQRSQRQTQASAGLIFDVLCEHDAGNMLLEQTRREVLEQQFEFQRLKESLEKIARQEIVIVETPRLSPLAFPIWAEQIQSRLSTQNWLAQIAGMAQELETAADG